ncbi:hypothetical protein pb186bvf_010070 [Paramecium bursaria]
MKMIFKKSIRYLFLIYRSILFLQKMEQGIKDLTGYILNKTYKLQKKLGAGAFGEIYQASYNMIDYAIKVEIANSKHPQLQFEYKLYQYLNLHNGNGIPKVYTLLTQDGYNFMVMELLGKSLEDLFNDIDRRFSLQTVTVLGIQMIECIEFLHQKQFLHRDIKPDNFLMGKEHKNKVYMVDFGLAKRYIAKDVHIPYKENKALTGTVRYSSINTHLGIEQSRRDDLEALGYVLMYFLRGQLPWQNLRANNQKEKYERILEKKLATSSQSLCKGYPQQFVDYLEYVKNLKFDDKPDYFYLKNLFLSIMKENELRIEYFYDWDDEATQREKIQIAAEDRLPTLPKNVKVIHQKTSSMGSINKIVQRQTTIVPTNFILANPQLNKSGGKQQSMNKARQILKKHSSLHYQ